MTVIPLDLTGLIHTALRKSNREPDGLLHASGDLVGSLRHSQLAIAGAPELDRGIAQDLRLETGTMWHKRLGEMLVEQGLPFMQEVRLNTWLPDGWGGTADWIFFDAERKGWVLGDLKTTKGEGIEWIERDGAKETHIWQVSAYWWALLDMGLPMLDRFAVYYLPMNDVAGKTIEPVETEVVILPREDIHAVMAERWQRAQHYLDSLVWGRDTTAAYFADPRGLEVAAAHFVTDALEPEQPRIQKMYWNKATSSFEVKLVPHWSAQFCPYPDELCACNTRGQTKIGEWIWYEGDPDTRPTEAWKPRNGYSIDPEVRPTPKDFMKKGLAL